MNDEIWITLIPQSSDFTEDLSMYGMSFGNLTVWGCLEAQSQCSPHELFIRLCPSSCTALECECPILPVFSVANHKGLRGLIGSVRRAPVPADGARELASILDCNFYSHYSRNQKKKIKQMSLFWIVIIITATSIRISGVFLPPLLLAFERGNSVLPQNIKGTVSCLRWS